MTKAHIITGQFFVLWWVIMAALLYFTWPPITFVIIFWFACGAFTTSIFFYEDVKHDQPLKLGHYLNWAIWFISGTASLLVLLSAGWCLYRRNEPWHRQTLR